MITTNIPKDKIEAKTTIPIDLKSSNEESPISDRRSETRKQIIFHLKCKIYNFESDTFETLDALVLNYGVNGLYFESAKSLQPGEPVCLTLVDKPPDPCDSEFAKSVHAQVVWCKPLNTDFDPGYGVGVKYFERIESHIGSL